MSKLVVCEKPSGLLIEPELNSADPFTMVPKADKKVFRSYFTYKLKTAE